MSPALTVATAKRVLTQFKRDRRSVGLLMVFPVLLLTLMWWLFGDTPGPTGAPLFDTLGPRLMGLFPLLLMFVITSVTTLRERQSGTLERLMASPASKADIVLGYAVAFGLVATVQALILTSFTIGVLGLEITGPVWAVGLVIILQALLGTTLGLAASSLAKTEFQAVQMMPAVILPQLFLAGLFIPRNAMPRVLEIISDFLPLSYAIDAINELLMSNSASGILGEVLILVGFIVLALVLGVATLRRRTD